MNKNQSHPLVVSTMLFVVMLGYQNCGKIESPYNADGINHKISENGITKLNADPEIKIEQALFDFEAEEMQSKMAVQDFETISQQSNKCYENQISCYDKNGSERRACLETKARTFLRCHGYKLVENESCVLGTKQFLFDKNNEARIVSICFDHPYFQASELSEQQVPPKRALHINECQESSEASWSFAWRSSNQFLNTHTIRFFESGQKVIDLAEETQEKTIIKDACGEPQQAQFLKLNLKLSVN